MRRRFGLSIVLAFLLVSVVAAVAPGPPLNLAATVNGNTVTLTWAAPATGGAASSYVVDAALSANGPSIASFPVAVNTLTVTGVPAGIYFVRVLAVNADGTSPPSNEVTVVVGSCATAPSPPLNLLSSVVGTFVTLSWTTPAGQCPVTGYSVQVGSGSGLSDLAVINTSLPGVSANAPAGSYFVRVVAVNPLGTSGPSNEILVTTPVAVNLTGRWSGTSTYFNAPFTFDLTQTGDRVGGTYRDQHDAGFAGGLVLIGSVVIDVNFGDTGIRFQGSIETPNRIRGTIIGSVIGGPHPFVMTR
jgi:predicted phage tail protein